jgi:hypothetical protein
MGLVWKAHKLAKPPANALELWKGAKVEAKEDLSGVPAGTPGRVILANGFNWLRYRVAFANGVELADLDERHITPIGRTAKKVAKRARKAS